MRERAEKKPPPKNRWGRGVAAGKIISLARKNRVPLHEDRNLVEVFSTIELRDDIPIELYKTAAEALIFMSRMSEKM